MWWQRTPRGATELIEECEAYLSGRYAELLQETSSRVPAWAWLDLLAHGSEDDLRRDAQRLIGQRGWQQARSFLAGEILALTDHGGQSLDILQRDVLTPLELRCFLVDGANRPHNPTTMVRLVLAALPERRAHRDRRPSG